MKTDVPRVFEQDRYQRLFEKGVAHWRANGNAEAQAAFRTILRDKPNHAETLRFMALTLRKQGNLRVAMEMQQRALRSVPGHFVVMSDLANLQLELNDLPEARRLASKAHELAPNFSDPLATLGLVLMRENKLQDAIAHFERAIAIDANCLVSQTNLATCQKLLSPRSARTEIEELTETVEREPDNAKAHLLLAIKHEEESKTSRAIVHAYRASQISPTAESLGLLASSLCSLGAFKEALPAFEQSVALAPYKINTGAAYLFAMNYNPYMSPKELFETYKLFAGKFLSAKKKYKHAANRSTAGRRLRIGYSSADFREHSLFYFVKPILEAHDRSQFELFAYSNAGQFDLKSAELRPHFDHWTEVSTLSDEQMAEKVQKDGIDVLVDLAGHSRGNRLGVFAMRPAPVQVSFLGYGYTTGLSEIDYFIGDENLTPTEADQYFSEKIWRVPAPAFSYRPPPQGELDVAPLPALTKGYVTFGSMTRLVRVNDEVLAVWRTILNRVPGSKLRLDSLTFGDNETLDMMKDRLVRLGFEPAQLELGVSRPHWKGYAEFDVSLDCWPHNSGTTTLDSLWMGVPVVSKLDRPSVGRFGAAFLRPVGLDDWIVSDVESYIERAVAAASDLPRLAELRRTLRDRLKASALMDQTALAGKLEAMYAEAMRIFEQRKAA